MVMGTTDQFSTRARLEEVRGMSEFSSFELKYQLATIKEQEHICGILRLNLVI